MHGAEPCENPTTCRCEGPPRRPWGLYVTLAVAVAAGVGILSGRGASPSVAAPAAAAPAPKEDLEHLVKPRLVADVAAVAPQVPFHVAVVLDIAPHWHVYWENPGDSGLATRAILTVPDGFSASAAVMPGPDRFELEGGIVNYGWSEQAVLFFDVLPPPQMAAAEASFTAEVKWLACNDKCIPGAAKVDLTLPAAPAGQRPAAANDALLGKWVARIPHAFSERGGATATWAADGKALRIEMPGCSDLDFFPTKEAPLTYTSRERSGATVTARFSSPDATAGLVRATCDGKVGYHSLQMSRP